MTVLPEKRDEVLREWLSAQDLEMPTAPIPQGFYTPIVVTGNLAHVAGQLPMQHGTLSRTGSVAFEADLPEAQTAAALCLLNQWAALAQAGIPLAKIRRVVKLTGYVQCPTGFTAQPRVLNGASELCLKVFGEAGIHARVAVGVACLPLDASVEIDGLYELESDA